MQALPSLSKDIVLVGGGHAHALVLRRLGMAPLAGARLTLVNPGTTAPYSGMLPGHIAGHYERDTLLIDLHRLCRFAGARLIDGRATAIDREARELVVETGAGLLRLGYDILSLDVGVTSDMPALPGFSEHASPAKPLDAFAARWEAFATDPGAARVVVIGAGVAGVELAMAARHRLAAGGAAPRVTLVDAGAALTALGGAARARLFEELRKSGIALVEQARVERVEADAVVLADGRSLAADFVIGAGGARAQDWLAATGLALNDGFVRVGADLRSVSDPAIFAVGDCAHFEPDPRPKAGVYAVRAAPVLEENLRREVAGTTPLQPFRPQRDYLKLISLGEKAALGEKLGLVASGDWVWRVKDRIDRAFMRKFTDYPAMAAEGVHDEPVLCAGCGAKIAPGALKAALAELPTPDRDDVVSLPGDDAAILAMEGDWQVITTDHLRGFTEDLALMTRIAAVHALGDVWAMGARPQAALASVTLPRMAPPMQARSMREVLAAASAVFRAEGAELVGGHSSMGAEVQLGFTVTGLRTEFPVGLDGAQVGDALILTKPLGTGTVLAGDMRGQARAEWVAAALASMARAQGDAARLLSTSHAMTDVTGFGLAGHLLAICEASGLGASVKLASIPLLPGAAELAEKGVRSTLWEENRLAVADRIALPAPAPAAADLLFDPQTAGGLLAAVPPGRASKLLAELEAAGFTAARIGQVMAGEVFVRVQ
ncbi:selenide, water dikinase SelD [Vannielia litorea]|uniref:Selenophosphate synthase n=1 Tax=Vannielia litorea TaxID=1217970 RepID=A0A1N6IFF0_9RHOB|nr:selenide, water dikinase SelD [Vannielia litorea]SIO30733.1 selenophosphate synthase [Vannielia litorea]